MEKQSRRILWIQGTVLFAISIIISGYSIYSGNHSVQVPLILSAKNPNLFPNDPFISTLLYYPSPIWRLIAFLSGFITLETLLLLLFLITRALVLFAASNLALSFYPGSWLAPVGAMAFFALIPSPLFGHGTLVINYFEHTSLSIAFLILAVSAFYKKKYLTWMIFLTLGFYINIMYGSYAFLYLTAVFLFDADYRTNWKRWVPPFLLFLLLASPLILSTLSSFNYQDFNRELWIQVSKIRQPYHLFPLSWEPYRFNLFLALIFFTGISLYQSKQEKRKLYNHYLVWSAVAIIFLTCAFAAAYILRSPVFLSMQIGRGTDLWFVFSVVAMISAFSYLVERNSTNKQLYAILYFVSIFWVWFFEFPILIEMIFIIVAIFIIWLPAWKRIFQSGYPLRLTNLVLIIIVFLGLTQFSIKTYSEKVISLMIQPSSQIQEVSRWAKENTSIEDMFLIDPNWDEFRALSQRPVFVTWKDGTAMLWKRDFINEWVPRIEAFGFDFYKTDQVGTPEGLNQLSRLYNKLDDSQVLKLTEKYPIHYWVAPKNLSSQFPVLYQTSAYKVLRIATGGENDG